MSQDTSSPTNFASSAMRRRDSSSPVYSTNALSDSTSTLGSIAPSAPPSAPPVPPAPVHRASHQRQPTLGSSSAYAPPLSMNQISMPYIKRHAVKRVKAAKEACNTELQKIIHSITLYFEERLGEREREEAEEQYQKAQMQQQHMRELQMQREAARSPAETAPDSDIHAAMIKQLASELSKSIVAENSPSAFDGRNRSGSGTGPQRTTESFALSRSHSRQASNSSSPLRKPANLPSVKPAVPLPISSPIPIPGDSSPGRKHGSSGPPSAWGSQPSTMTSKRASRVMQSHMAPPPPQSGQSSRSTSRSRSPMPFQQGSQHTPSVSYTESSIGLGNSPKAPNKRLSRHMMDIEPPVDPFMSTLHDLIAVSTDIMEMSASTLTSRPGMGSDLVRKVQDVGRAWEDNPDWHGRTWYVTVLLAVASLSRVVEWFEAERQFWNFEDNDEEEAEPLTFVLKPEYDSPPVRKAPLDDDNPLRLSRPSLEDRRSRDERVPQKDLRGATSPPPADVEKDQDKTDLTRVESTRIQATDNLRQKANKAKSSNILLELNLDGDHFLYINRTWYDVIGSDPDTLVNMGLGISSVLHPDDAHKFKEASDRLQSDDSHTVEIQFRIRVEPDEDDDDAQQQSMNGPVYKQMEGSGMLMLDRVDHVASHTMWVLKPAPIPEVVEPQKNLIDLGQGRNPPNAIPPLARRLTETAFSANVPLLKTLSASPILCRICENQIPSWFFEKHNETCAEVHKFDADVAECNDSIRELKNTVRELLAGLERNTPGVTLEYRGIPIFSPGNNPSSSSPIQVFRPPLASRMQRVNVRKAQQRLLEQADDILQVAWEISMPALREEESKEPIERQRLLSPVSEDKIHQVITWSKPMAEDPALSRLIQDVELLMRTKLDTINRMQNTVRYAEKIRQEWEEKYEEALATVEEEDQLPIPPEEAIDSDNDDVASTTSEYDFGREPLTAEPTPIPGASTVSLPIQAPTPVIPIRGGSWSQKLARSSTPNSVTSPLATAQPIVATTPEASAPNPLMAMVESSAQTIRARRSMQNLNSTSLSGPGLVVTPPISPAISPQDVRNGTNTVNTSTGSAHLRRHSTVLQPILSPTTVVAPGPLSPRLPSVAPSAKSNPSSIKDFDIIKPISKGAFGSVFLAKKKTTGDYFAIKVLKKADMIAKNQITNVKAERMILMKQAESPFVVKLYFTFQSKDNLYLVMEYLNGGDCAALVKTLGALPEEWTRAYVAEVVLGLEYLHERGIVHRDLKPDNLLIDQHGHLKLTDFGLSRIGLLGRQTRDTRRLPERLLGGKPGRGRRSPGSRPTSFDSTHLSSPLLSADLQGSGSYFNPRASATTHFPADDLSESSGSEGVAHMLWRRGRGPPSESPLQSFATDLTNELRSSVSNNHLSQSHSNALGASLLGGGGGTTPPGEQKFVGTPDYLAPEVILGSSADDRTVDWWALGVITYEFLYGIPPFHAETPDKVFENILSMRIDWHDEWVDFSPEARNFMERLMCYDPKKRLGFNGAQEVKSHPFLASIEWDKVMEAEPAFVPQVTDPESTDYFDPRGAIPQLFQDDEAIAVGRPASAASQHHLDFSPGVNANKMVPRDYTSSPASDDFGTFNFKNLGVLKQANDEVIKKMRNEQLTTPLQSLADPTGIHNRRRSLSQKIKKPNSVVTNFEPRQYGSTNPPSPSTSTSSIASSPSRASMGPSTPGSVQAHLRRPSEYSAIDRFKHMQLESEIRRNSLPSRLRTASVSSADHEESVYSGQEHWGQNVTGQSSPPPQEPKRTNEAASTTDRAVVCMIAEDNPISAKILETLLVRLGCRCVLAADGAEAISTAHGDIKFDLILMDYHMPVVDGESAARYIKSTNNLNKSTPIVAVSAYVGQDSSVASNLFAACISKPVHKADLLNMLKQLGFKTSTATDSHGTKQISKVAVS